MSAIFMTYYQNLDNILDNVSYVSDFTNNFFILRESHKEKGTEQDTSFLIPTLTLTLQPSLLNSSPSQPHIILHGNIFVISTVPGEWSRWSHP